MGLFRKKKRMIDIRKLQRMGMPRLPVPRQESSVGVVTNDEGFVEVGGAGVSVGAVNPVDLVEEEKVESAGAGGSGGGDFFNFMDNPASSAAGSVVSAPSLSPRTTPSEDLRKISKQISDLDNKLYKMEQRIELLERKAGIGEL